MKINLNNLNDTQLDALAEVMRLCLEYDHKNTITPNNKQINGDSVKNTKSNDKGNVT